MNCVKYVMSRFLYGFAKIGDSLLIEVVLPCGTICGIFRNISCNSLVVAGKVDQIKWTAVTPKEPPDEEILELAIPTEFHLPQLTIQKKNNTVIFKIPKKYSTVSRQLTLNGLQRNCAKTI